MTVQELIDELLSVEDKSKKVLIYDYFRETLSTVEEVEMFRVHYVCINTNTIEEIDNA